MTTLADVAPAIIAGRDPLLRKLGATGRKFRLEESLIYLSAVPGVGQFTVPAGFVTNFHSIPIGARNLLEPTDYAESAIAHDWLYEQGEISTLLTTRKIERGQADQVHREILRLLKAPGWKIGLMYAGIRVGGWRSWGKYREQDAARKAGLIVK